MPPSASTFAPWRKMVWSAGINVPVITCWTKQARENSDPDMARIMDTCNFYPRWKIVAELTPALEKLRREEPASPLAITELQGGWFSEFGGVLSVNQDGVDAAQISMITKTALELGVTSFSYYMGFGGTNFDWAAKKLTTTYDYAAPIREPGGLWDKYYAVRGMGQSLRALGSVLTRAVALPGAQCTNANVSVSERTNGPSAVLFVRENANAPQRYKMTFTDPHSPSKRFIFAPRQGELELAPREMKMLPVQIPVSGGRLCYSTGELLAHGVNLDRDFLILYDVPGRILEMGLATDGRTESGRRHGLSVLGSGIRNLGSGGAGGNHGKNAAVPGAPSDLRRPARQSSAHFPLGVSSQDRSRLRGDQNRGGSHPDRRLCPGGHRARSRAAPGWIWSSSPGSTMLP